MTPVPPLNYNQPFCYVLVGVVGSGKSKIRETLLQHPTMKDAVLVSTDQCIALKRKIMTATDKEIVDSFSRKTLKSYTVNAVRHAVAEGRSIIVDRCNITKKSRRQFLRFIPDNYNVVIVVMDWDEREILNRMRYDPIMIAKDIPIENVKFMINCYEPPEDSEAELIIHQPAIYG